MPDNIAFTIPFPPRVNPDRVAASQRNLRWARNHGLITGQQSEQRYLKSQVAEFGAYAYPDASGADLDLVYDVMGWFFLFDDQFAAVTEDRMAEATAACLDHIAVVCAIPRDTTTGHRPIVEAFADCWRRMCHQASPQWRARAAHNWLSYFTGQLAEIADGRSNAESSYTDQLRTRLKTIGVEPSLCLAERVGGHEVPAIAWYSSLLQRIRNAAVRNVIAVNEVFSLGKEEAHGEPNLALTLMHERSCTRTEAVEMLRDLADLNVQQLVDLQQRVPRLCQDLRLDQHSARAVAQHVQAICTWVRGNYDWHQACGRYQPVPSGRQGGGHEFVALNTEDLSSLRTPDRDPTTRHENRSVDVSTTEAASTAAQ